MRRGPRSNRHGTKEHIHTYSIIPTAGAPALLEGVKSGMKEIRMSDIGCCAGATFAHGYDSYEDILKEWTGDGLYGPLNDCLASLGKTLTSKYDAKITKLTAAVRSLGTTGVGGTVYRGISNIGKKDLKIYKENEGSTISWTTFASTSTSEEVAYNFAGSSKSCLFTIETTCESPSKAYCDYPNCHRYSGEEEVLWLPGVRFEIRSYTEEGDRVLIELRELEMASFSH